MFDEAIHELENLSKFALRNQLVQSHPSLLPTLIKCSISSSTTKMAPKSPIWRSNLEASWKSSFWCFSFPALKLGSLPLTSVQWMLLCSEFDNGLLARGQPPTNGNTFICGNLFKFTSLKLQSRIIRSLAVILIFTYFKLQPRVILSCAAICWNSLISSSNQEIRTISENN